MAAVIPGQEEHFVASGLEFGYAYASTLIDSAEGRCPDGDVAFYHPTTHPGARLPHIVITLGDGSEVSTHGAIARTGLTLFTADPQSWTTRLAATPKALPLKVVALNATSQDGHAALVDLFEVGECGAVVVRPDGHVVWRTRADSSAADRLGDFVERAWSDVYPHLQIDVNQNSA
jgi:hypothetical protein